MSMAIIRKSERERLLDEVDRLRSAANQIDRLDAAEAEAVADCPGLAWLEEHGFAELRRRCGKTAMEMREAVIRLAEVDADNQLGDALADLGIKE